MANSEEFDDFEMEDEYVKTPKGNKKLSVERIYQKKTQLEHILLRPDTYIGSVERVTQTMWVVDEDVGMVNREITFVPGLYKIFDEILVNAADNKQRDKNMDCIKIEINPEKNKISIWNNGQGIPVVEHKDEKMFVPSLIFGHLLTSSNYNDEERKVTGGRNGYGAKLCNIFSTKFTVETAAKQYNKQFRQTWKNNMGTTEEPKIVPFKGTDYTCVTFYPDLAKFKMETLEKDMVALMTKRAYDIAGCSRGVKVFLNDKRLQIKNFKDYIELYVKNKTDDSGDNLVIVHEIVNDRWEVAATLSEKGFQQVSFVNSIATTKGGRHVDYITDQLASKISEAVKKKNKGGKDVKPFQIKSHMWVFVNCLIENPTFDSQTKENMTLQLKNFGSKCVLTEKFVNSALKCGIVEAIMQWVRFKAQTELSKKCSGKKQNKLKGIPKLEDANDAGTRHSIDCTLILTEGDSAKTLAVSGLGVVGRDKYGVFPLKGKILNVREATHKQILENAEINNIIKIMGLQYKKKYETEDDLKTLRYGRMMVMTDQDQDGSHIKGLLINFIHHNWPSLLKLPFLEEFITPIVKAIKGKHEKSFYSLPEFEEWKTETPNWNKYKVKYYKGLGTSTAKEAKEYFSDMQRHRIKFKYQGTEDDNAIQLAFSKKMIDMRKEWLTNGMEERKRRRELGLPELYLYGKDCKAITYNDFVNKELILFSNMDNERSIPSAIDGLKPGQRKVLFTCIKRNDKREVKVAQLCGSVAEKSAYHHGEQSLAMTIVNLAQNYVGSNNINILLPIGQFGTRLQGGKDAASPRYIFTNLNPVTKALFSSLDAPLYNYLFDDNLKIEPEYYVPIIPMILVNGTQGIGTGWSTNIPNYNPRDLVKNIHRMINGEEPHDMMPWFKNFRGTIDRLDNAHFQVSGEVAILDDNQIEITELPIRTWTQAYKESVLEPMLHGSEKTPAFINDYKEYNTDTTVRFVVTMAPEKFRQARNQGFHKVFKLQTTIATTSMVLFDKLGCIRRYDDPVEILREFYDVRSLLYEKRKEYMVGYLEAEALRLKNQARFILEKIENKIVVENKKRLEMIKILVDRKYDSDPIKAWNDSQKSEAEDEESGNTSDNDEKEKEDTKDSGGPHYDYLLGMTLWALTKERKDELLKNRDNKIKELEDLKSKTPSDLWRNDLKVFMEELDKQEQVEREDELGQPKLKAQGKGKKAKKMEDKPSEFGERVLPSIDEDLKKKFDKKPVVPGEKKVRRKKEDKKNDDEEEDEKNLSLSERVMIASAKKEGKAPPKTKDMKQTKLNFQSIGEKKPKKEKVKISPKKKGKNPWSDSEEEENSDFESEEEALPDDYIPPEKREMARRQASSKAKYKYAESDEDNKMIGSSSEDDDPANRPAANKANHKRPPPAESEQQNGGSVSPVLSDSDDSYPAAGSKPTNHNVSRDDLFNSLLEGKADDDTPPKPSAAALTRNAGSDSNSSGDEMEVEASKAVPPKKRPKKLMTDSSHSDSDSNFTVEPVKKLTKPAPKKKAKKDDSGDDSDDFKPKKKAKKDSEDDSDSFKPKKKAKKADSGDDSDSFKPKKKAKKADSGDDSDGFKPKKKAAPKEKKEKAPKQKKEKAAPKKPKAVKKPKKKGSDSDDDFGSDMSDGEDRAPVPSAARAPRSGRAKAPTKFTFSDSEED